MNVISDFDGMSCGMLALKRANISVNNYYAYEINKYATKVSEKNFSEIIHLGDINNWKFFDQLPKIDLLIGGSPCQGFSLAGRGLNFNDPRSKLFFVFVDMLKHYRKLNPELLFLLENVRMKKEYENVITDIMEVEPIQINSALVSAQNRVRNYWTNISGITQPEDKGILLKDIIENGEVDREKSYCIDANYFKGGNPRSYFEDGRRQLVFEHQSHKRTMVRVGTASDINGHDILKRVYSISGKSPTLDAAGGGNRQPKIALDDFHYRKLTVTECEKLQTVPVGYTDSVSNTQRYKMLGNGWTVDVIAHIFSFIRRN